MIAQTVSTSTILYFSSEELHAQRLKPEQITLSQALTLIRTVFETSGQAMPSFPEIQIFSTNDGVLLFLRPVYSESKQFSRSYCIPS